MDDTGNGKEGTNMVAGSKLWLSFKEQEELVWLLALATPPVRSWTQSTCPCVGPFSGAEINTVSKINGGQSWFVTLFQRAGGHNGREDRAEWQKKKPGYLDFPPCTPKNP